ncbi:MAG: hypothetical protein RR873_06840 [Christensenella sp.]
MKMKVQNFYEPMVMKLEDAEKGIVFMKEAKEPKIKGVIVL